MKISIALATYNGEKFLQEQLDSIVSQNRLPDEIIICDDGSRDMTVEILERFLRQAPFLSIIHKNIENKGTGYSFKKAIDLCTGEIIIFCDQDDIWLPNKIEEIEKAFTETPSLDYVITNANIIDDESNYLGYSLWAQRKFSKYWINQFNSGYEFKVLQKKNIVTGMSTAISRRVKELGNNKPSYVLHDAWYIYIASICGLNGKLIEKTLIQYRQHRNQQFGSTKQKIWDTIANLHNGHRKSVDVNIQILEPLVDYTMHLLSEKRDSDRLIYLKEKLDHFRARKVIVESERSSRINKILREILTGRYCKYSAFKNTLIDYIS